jgi:hypothetical protein
MFLFVTVLEFTYYHKAVKADWLPIIFSAFHKPAFDLHTLIAEWGGVRSNCAITSMFLGQIPFFPFSRSEIRLLSIPLQQATPTFDNSLSNASAISAFWAA